MSLHWPYSMRTHQEPLLLLLSSLLPVLAAAYSPLPPAGTSTIHADVPAILPCSPDQASALIRLKLSFSTTNMSTMPFRSWRVGTDCCRWEGIRCDAVGGRVTSLDLGDRGLWSGGLNPALFRLTSLEYLNLAYNDFNGSQLPSTGFERLSKLTHLNLSSCGFNGEIPAGIGSLTSLVSLDLSTRVDGLDLFSLGYILTFHEANDDWFLEEPNLEALIENLSNLRELHLGMVYMSDNSANWCGALAKHTPKLQVLSLPLCSLSGPICDSLSTLDSLAVIDLEHNQISGPLPDFLANFSNLTALKLRRNDLEGWVSPAIFGHKKLETINLSYNPKISGHLPNFTASSNLKNLIVGSTNFSGTIPSSISNIKTLKTLSLSAVGFSGELPSSIGKLKSLNVLEISGMGLVGSIPSWVANLTSLTTLEFSSCSLTGSIPSFIGGLTKLETLAFVQCGFSGEIPSHIFNLTQLHLLFLNSNNFFGMIELSSFTKFSHLFTLDLSDNNFLVVDGGYNSSLAHLPKLSYLSLSGCNMLEFPNFLRHQDEITYLDFSHNKIHGAIPEWTWEIWNYMIALHLDHNQINSIGHSPLLPLDLQVFDISYNMMEGPVPIPQGSAYVLHYSHNMFSSIPSDLGCHLSYVSLLSASNNNFSGKIPSYLCGATSIEVLDLSYNNFNGSIPSCLMENDNGMQSLYLNENQLHGEFPDNIIEGCTFEALDFHGNLIDGKLPRSLVACKNLEVLDVGKNQISDSFPCWMSTLHRLEVLVLKSNKFFGHVAQSLVKEKSTCSFPSARIIDISSNNFYGPLPSDEWFKGLKSMIYSDSNMSLVMGYEVPNLISSTYDYSAELTYKGQDTTFAKILRTLVFIDISNNAFSGSIPETIGGLLLIHGLNMSHNFLTGKIPSQLGRLNQLEALDLSSNELSGVIPQELASLNFLTTLNLSNNKLEGSIPELAQFLTFSNSSFMGNDGLCGLPLTKKCSNTTTPNATPPPPSKDKSADIMLFLFTGIGFGVGFAISFIVTWGVRIGKTS